jgi:hypothetical protein
MEDHQRRFHEIIPVISDLKLRAGYGVSGNSLGFDAFTAQLIYGIPPGGGKFLSNGKSPTLLARYVMTTLI